MPYTIDWYLPQRIIYYKAVGIVSNEQVLSSMSQIRDYLTQGIDATHVILDTTELEKLPLDIHFYQANYPPNPKNTGWIILVGGDTLVQFIATVITKVSSSRFKSCATLEAALAFLQKQDNTLNAMNDS